MKWRAARLAAGSVLLAGIAVASVSGGTTQDRNGVPVVSNGRQQALEEAAGGSVIGVCVLSGHPWGPMPPAEADVLAAAEKGPGTKIGEAFTIGPLRDAADTRQLDVRWSDGGGGHVFTIDRTATLPTVVTLTATTIAGFEVWQVDQVDVVGGCDGDQVPSVPAP